MLPPHTNTVLSSVATSAVFNLLSQRLPVQSVEGGLVVALADIVCRIVHAGAPWSQVSHLEGGVAAVGSVVVGDWWLGLRNKNAESANLSISLRLFTDLLHK